MKTKKYKWNRFLFYDYDGIVSQCEKMALQGWKLKKIGAFFQEYERMEPQPLKYAVTYFAEASDFNPDAPQSQQTFQEYCENVGWKLATENAQMLIFYSEKENPVPIETDESLKLEVIHRSMKKNFLPGEILLLFIAVLQFVLQTYDITKKPISFFSDANRIYVIMLWGLVFFSVFMSLCGYVRWYQASQKSILLGGACVNKKTASYSNSIVLVLTGILLVLWMHSLQLKGLIWIKMGIGALIVQITIFFIIRSIRDMLRKKKVSKKVNLTVTIITGIVITLVGTAGITFVAILGYQARFLNKKPVDIYTTTSPDGNVWDWEVYQDDIPLKVEDLMEVSYDHYSYERKEHNSIFLKWVEANQSSFPDGEDVPDCRYEIVDVKMPFLYEMVLNEFKNQRFYPKEAGNRYVPINDSSWKANQVYQFYYQEEAANEYLVCWDSRILKIWLSWAPTPEQIKIMVEKVSL